MIELIKRLAQALRTLFAHTPGHDREANTEGPAAQAIPPWVAWGLREIGFHERPGNRGIERYIALAHCGSAGDPWCAIFANAGLEASGIRGTRSALARSFEHSKHFVRLPGPAFGAITTMWRGSPSAVAGHVFYYLGENDRGVLALGGNQSDQVRKQYEPPARIVGYFWPASQPVPNVGKIIVEDQHGDEGSET